MRESKTHIDNPRKAFNLIGEKFGDLIVIKFGKKSSSGVNMWVCKCVCGKETIVRSSDLRSGKTRSCGCLRGRKSPSQNLIGRRYSKLLVIEYSHKKSNRHFWKCLCDCGEESICATATLNSGRATRCFRCGRKYSEPGSSGLTILIKQYKWDAQRRGYEWELEREFVKDVTKKNCFYCGDSPSQLIKTNTTDNHGDYLYNGIDRFDNTRGYIKDNCIPCCGRCNYWKSNFTSVDFLTHIEKIYNKSIKHDERIKISYRK